MALVPMGVEVVKQVTWRGGPELFSNVYHYLLDEAITETQAKNVIDAVVAAERPIFPSIVTFKQGRCWGRTDTTQAASITQAIADYSSLGTSGYTTDGSYEETLVVENFIGRGPAGHKQFLRKYLHMCRYPSGEGAGAVNGNTALTGTTLAAGVAYWNRIKQITANSNTWDLCTKKGKKWDNVADAPVVLPYLHIRQFHQ